VPAKIDSADALSKFTGSLVRRAQQRHLAVWQSEVSAEITNVQYAALEILQRTPGDSKHETVSMPMQ
jgi:hypothetical protein